MISSLFTLALLAQGTTSTHSETMPQPFSAERSWQIQRIGPPTISPDGQRVVCAVTRFDMEASKGIADLWMWSSAGGEGRRLTSQASSDGSPLFSPDGARLLFVAKREGDTAPQLYVLPMDGGEAERITSVATGVAQPLWFPDGERIAFLARVWPDLTSFAEQAKRLEEREKSKSSARAWEGAPVTAWDQWIDDERERRARGADARHRLAAPAQRGAARQRALRDRARRAGARVHRRLGARAQPHPHRHLVRSAL